VSTIVPRTMPDEHHCPVVRGGLRKALVGPNTLKVCPAFASITACSSVGARRAAADADLIVAGRDSLPILGLSTLPLSEE